MYFISISIINYVNSMAQDHSPTPPMDDTSKFYVMPDKDLLSVHVLSTLALRTQSMWG